MDTPLTANAGATAAGMIDDATRAAFRRDGVVCVRGAFDASWLDLLGQGMDRDLAAPSARLTRHTKEPGAPAYIEDYWVWNEVPEFRSFVFDSPVGALAGALLGAPRINLVMDNWFLREAGSKSRPPFHQDLAYFDFEGSMCVLWLPLEPVTSTTGIHFVRGSHLWDKLFMRVRFGDGHLTDAPPANARANGAAAKPGSDPGSDSSVLVNGQRYHAPPDVAADPGAYDLASFDMERGDCIFFDMRTLHGGLSDVIPTETVRRFTLRVTAPDGKIAYRGDWAKDERAQFQAAGYAEGDALDGPFFPRLWG